MDWLYAFAALVAALGPFMSGLAALLDALKKIQRGKLSFPSRIYNGWTYLIGLVFGTFADAGAFLAGLAALILTFLKNSDSVTWRYG